MTVTELAEVVAREERIAKGDAILSRTELAGLIGDALFAAECREVLAAHGSETERVLEMQRAITGGGACPAALALRELIRKGAK